MPSLQLGFTGHPQNPKSQGCETNNANTWAQQWGGLSQICASFRQNPCPAHGCLNQATASGVPNLTAQLAAPGCNHYGTSTPRGHAGAFTKCTWFYTTRLVCSLTTCPDAQVAMRKPTQTALAGHKDSAPKERHNPRPGEETGSGTSQVDCIEIILLPTLRISFCERPHRTKSAVIERQQ